MEQNKPFLNLYEDKFTAQETGGWCLFVFFAAAIFGYHKIYSGDVWMHLAAARETLKLGHVLTTDVFLYTTSPGTLWINHSWLAQLFLYAAYCIGGLAGLVALRMILVGAGASLFCLLGIRKGANPIFAAFCATIYVSLTAHNLLIRPLLFALPLVAGILLLLNRPSRKRLAGVVVLQLLWANMHASFLLGIVIVGLYVAEAAIEAFWAKGSDNDNRWSETKALAVTLLATGAVCLLNPNGYAIFIYGYRLGNLDWVVKDIVEWRALDLALTTHFYYIISIVTGMFFIAYAYMKFRPEMRRAALRHVDIIIMAVLIGQSIFHQRFMRLACFLMIPVTAAVVSIVTENRKRFRFVFVALLVIVASVLFVRVLRGQILSGHFGIGIREEVIPIGEIEFMKRHNVSGNIACDQYAGGYISWAMPGSKPSSDGRCLVNDPATVGSLIALRGGKPGWKEAFPKPGESDVFLMRNLSNGLPFNTMLADWSVVEWSNNWSLWIRRNGAYAKIAREFDVSYTSPLVFMDTYSGLPLEQKQAVIRALRKKYKENSRNSLAMALCGYAYYVEAMAALTKVSELTVSFLNETDKPSREAVKQKVNDFQNLFEEFLVESNRCYGLDIDSSPSEGRSYYGMARNLAWLGYFSEAKRCLSISIRRGDRLNRVYPVFGEYSFANNVCDVVKARYGAFSPEYLDATDFRDWIKRGAVADRKYLINRLREMGREKEIPEWLLKDK